jgi:hypothetical protein
MESTADTTFIKQNRNQDSSSWNLTITLDTQALRALIKESVREVMREEWFKFFEMLTPSVDDQEQGEIEASFAPKDYPAEDFIDVTSWFDDESQAQ